MENLETRALLTFDFATAFPNVGDFITEGTVEKQSPQQITLRFTPGVVVDPTTLGGITLTRSGGYNDAFGNGNDIDVTPGHVVAGATVQGYIGVNDVPNRNEVVLRFAEPLPDDAYRFTITGAAAGGLKTIGGEQFKAGGTFNLNFKLDLGAEVKSVVPQPVLRAEEFRVISAVRFTDGDLLRVDAGQTPMVFEFDNNSSVGTGNIGIAIPATEGAGSRAGIAAAIAAEINSRTATGDATATAIGDSVYISGQAFQPVVNYVPVQPLTIAAGATRQQLVTLGNTTRITDGDALTVTVGVQTMTFEFDNDNNVTSGRTQISILTPDTPANRTAMATAMANAIAARTPSLGASASAGNGVLTITGATLTPTVTLSTYKGGNVLDTQTLTQLKNKVIVYFNPNDPLAKASAETVSFYSLIDTATGTAKNPTGVVYNATNGTAVLTFNAADIADSKTFRLHIGTYVAPRTISTINPADVTNIDSAFANATTLGSISTNDYTINASLDPMTPTGLGYGLPPGGNDEPGHRTIPVEDHGAGAGTGVGPAGAIDVIQYNFQTTTALGSVQGNPVFNVITETQKQRAREIFELFSYYTGIRFVETANSGMTVATADVRVVSPTIPPNAVAGIANGSLAVMNANTNWGKSEYGGAWFGTALHEIGHNLGLGHAYDLPAVQGNGISGEPVFTGDYDFVHLLRNHPRSGTDIDTYAFVLPESGEISLAANANASQVDTLLTLYKEDGVTGVRTMIARNDDYNGVNAFLNLKLAAGKYFFAVTSTGNDQFNPEVPDSGYNGRSDGAYQVKFNFKPDSTTVNIVDTQGSQLDGDHDGIAGGAYTFNFQTAASTGSQTTNNTIFVDKNAGTGGNGTLGNPYKEIDLALAQAAARVAATANPVIVRIVGNGGTDGDGTTAADALPYLIGVNPTDSTDLADGSNFIIPKGVMVMIDAGAVLKFVASNIDVGSSSGLVDRSNAKLQILGTPTNNVQLTSYHNDALGGDSDAVGPGTSTGQWGGVALRADSDLYDTVNKRAQLAFDSSAIFLNTVNNATITFGGGSVDVNGSPATINPIHVVSTRPTLTFNRILSSASAGMSADPNAFEDSLGRTGPDIHGNILLNNTKNGLFIRIATNLGQVLDKLDVPARFKSTDIVYVIDENLVIAGDAGKRQRIGRLTIDPGVIVKLNNTRIELERGPSSLFAEGTASNRIIFTSEADTRFGAGGTFDTNGNLPNTPAAGNWAGIVLNATSRASIDNAYIAYGGGTSFIEGSSASFNVIEAQQASLRLANSLIENNASGIALSGNREGRQSNVAATVFIRGAQPVIVNNDFRNNLGSLISVNANALKDIQVPDWGRQTGLISRYAQFDDNQGPLVRLNKLTYDTANNAIGGMEVRGEEMTVQGVWDDTDIVHVLRSEIIVQNFHTSTGLRLISAPNASLVVKLSGNSAGFSAQGFPLDIDDRIGGSVQILGQPGYPVVLTSLNDDTIGASLDPTGKLVRDTNNNGSATTANARDWRSVKFERYSNDRNVSVYNEQEFSVTKGIGTNETTSKPELLGVLAPDEKSGDDQRRLGFEVHGYIAADTPTDKDVYKFTGYGQSTVWFDIDKSTYSLDTVIELLASDGTVLATSDNSEALGTITGAGLGLVRDSWLGGDYWGSNPFDAGMRVVLPGTAGQQDSYFVRVSSKNGKTSGEYQLQIRVNQRDDVPGSTVRYGDIRYATNGIEAYGLPGHSPLLGESGENAANAGVSNNEGIAGAQELGNLMQADRNTISVDGTIAGASDIDWYTFELSYDLIQVVIPAAKTWSTIFDLDYASGSFGRGDFTMSIFDAQGRLIYISRDSNVQDDQPGAGQGVDTDDLSRGTAGKLDPYIGPVQLPADDDNTGSYGTNGSPPNPSSVPNQFRYYIAISSDDQLPRALNATYTANPDIPAIRLEPVNSIRRVAEDHIGFNGYKSNGAPVAPETPSLIDINTVARLATEVTPFTLTDVTLFVSTSNSLYTYDPFDASFETTIAPGAYNNGAAGDLEMRPDGRLFQAFGVSNDAGNVATIRELDPGTGGILSSAGDGVANQPTTPTFWNLSSDTVTAIAFRRTGVGAYADENYLALGGGALSGLYRARSSYSAVFDSNDARFSRRGTIQDAAATITTLTTGMQFVQDSGALYGVSAGGQFYNIDTSNGVATNVRDFSGTVPEGFAGLAAAPQNVENARFRGMFFAISTTGRLVCINPTTGTLVANVFDTDGDRVGDSNISQTTVGGGVTGLAFSPLDINLWHPTMNREGDNGHGVNAAPDNSRYDPNNVHTPNSGILPATQGEVINGRTSSEISGGASMWFGLEDWTPTPDQTRRYFSYGTSGGQYGVLGSVSGANNASYDWQQELLTNPYIKPAGTSGGYGLAGGAYGSLVTNSFSLAGYNYNDKPTLYFNYFLQTQGANGKQNNAMRDAARVFASTDNGVTWQLVATNNSAISGPGFTDAELPSFLTSSSDRRADLANQRVQELFDNTGVWRQARVDMGTFAGQGNIKLRFDFTTSGEMDPNNPLNAFGAGTTQFGNFNSSERGQQNQFEGFYIDDIIVGFTERGEMVTGANNGGSNTGFFQIPQDPDPQKPSRQLQGDYQFEIRRGTEYGFQKDKQLTDDITLGRQFDTNDQFIPSPSLPVGSIGSQNFNASTAVPAGWRINNAADIGGFAPAYATIVGNTVIGTGVTVNPAFTPTATGVGEFDEPTNTLAAGEGVNSLFMDAKTAGTAGLNWALWNVDITSQASLYLIFQYASLNAQFTIPASYTPTGTAPSASAFPLPQGSGVAFRMGGDTTWYRVFAPGNTNGDWSQQRINLITAIRNAGFDPTALTGAQASGFTLGFFQAGDSTWAGFESPVGSGAWFNNNGGLAFDDIRLTPTASIGSTGTIGDQNLQRQQGQLIIENNIVRFSGNTGILVEAASRNPGSQMPLPGSPINFQPNNGARLAPGAVIRNNVVTDSTVGIRVAGEPNTTTAPIAAVPYARVVNNTLYNTATAIQVANNAAPTLMNNLISKATTGISLDPTSQSTEIFATLFHDMASPPLVVGANSIVVASGQPMFVNTATGNFYLAAGSRAIDSSLDSNPDRPVLTTLLTQLGIPDSPIIAPALDLYGKARVDDPTQASDPGTGNNVFKDRGAVERADFSGPFATLEIPVDGAANDTDPLPTVVRIFKQPDAAQVSQFIVRLNDLGIGVDDTLAGVASNYVLTRDGVTLSNNIDYVFTYLETTNQVVFASTSVFPSGVYQITLDNTQIRDLAGNSLLNNQTSGTTQFTIELSHFPPVFNPVADLSLMEDPVPPTQVINITGINASNSAPNPEPLQNLRWVVTNDNPTLIPTTPTMNYTSNNTTGQLVFQLGADQSGVANITLTLWDDGQDGVAGNGDDKSFSRTFKVTVGAVNDPPTIDQVADINVVTIQPTINVPLTNITAGGGESQALQVTATSSNTGLIPTPTVNYSSPNNTGSLVLSPVPGQVGVVTITVVVRDAGLNGTLEGTGSTPGGDDAWKVMTFKVTLAPVNAPPTLNPVNGIGLVGWQGPQTVNLGNITAGGTDNQPLRIQVSSSNTSIIPTPTVNYTSPNNAGTLTFTARGDTTAVVTIDVTVFDSGLDLIPGNGDDAFVTQSFTVSVQGFNYTPTPVADTRPDIFEDNSMSFAAALLLSNDGLGNNFEASGNQQLTVTDVNSPVGGTVQLVNGSIIFTPNKDFNGAASFNYVVTDNAFTNGAPDFKSATARVTFNVIPVNDAPIRITGPSSNTLTVRQDQTIASVGLQNLNYAAGPTPDEGSQILTYTVTEVPPTTLGQLVLGDGRTPVTAGTAYSLTALQNVQFKPNGLTNGSANFKFVVRDNGGTQNGGIDNIVESFTVTVSPLDPANVLKYRMLRAYNPNADYHFFTTTKGEFDNAVKAGYRDEATNQPGFDLAAQNLPGTLPVHRMYNLQTGRHYYTTSSGERDELVAKVPVTDPNYGKIGWRYEKDEPYIYPTQVPGTVEVFRLYNKLSGVHLYTQDPVQKDAILAQFPGIWFQHASLGYAFPDPARSTLPSGAFVFAEAMASTAVAPVMAPVSAPISVDLSTDVVDRLIHTVGSTPASVVVDVATDSVVDRDNSPVSSTVAPATVPSATAHETESVDAFWQSFGQGLGTTETGLDLLSE